MNKAVSRKLPWSLLIRIVPIIAISVGLVIVIRSIYLYTMRAHPITVHGDITINSETSLIIEEASTFDIRSRARAFTIGPEIYRLSQYRSLGQSFADSQSVVQEPVEDIEFVVRSAHMTFIETDSPSESKAVPLDLDEWNEETLELFDKDRILARLRDSGGKFIYEVDGTARVISRSNLSIYCEEFCTMSIFGLDAQNSNLSLLFGTPDMLESYVLNVYSYGSTSTNSKYPIYMPERVDSILIKLTDFTCQMEDEFQLTSTSQDGKTYYLLADWSGAQPEYLSSLPSGEESLRAGVRDDYPVEFYGANYDIAFWLTEYRQPNIQFAARRFVFERVNGNLAIGDSFFALESLASDVEVVANTEDPIYCSTDWEEREPNTRALVSMMPNFDRLGLVGKVISMKINGNEQVLSPWAQLSGDVQGALIGTMITAIGAVLSFLLTHGVDLQQWLIAPLKPSVTNRHPIRGYTIVQLCSGRVYAGKLVKTEQPSDGKIIISSVLQKQHGLWIPIQSDRLILLEASVESMQEIGEESQTIKTSSSCQRETTGRNRAS